jgi:hypothetical protein
MKRNLTKLTIILVFVSLILAQTPIIAKTLNTPEVTQQYNQWCWAAASNSVLGYYGKNISQCNIANYTRTVCTWHNFGSVHCCTSSTQGCNYWNYMYGSKGSIEDILEHWAVNNYATATYLSTSKINTEINNNRPYIFRWGWDSGGGHFLVGRGISSTTLYYMDPWFGEGYKSASYSWVVSGGSHTWTHTLVMTTNLAGIVINLNATLYSENAWILDGYYAGIEFSVSNGSNVTSYTILRNVPGGSYQAIADISANELSNNAYTFYDGYLLSGTYYYKVQAKNSSGNVLKTSAIRTITVN